MVVRGASQSDPESESIAGEPATDLVLARSEHGLRRAQADQGSCGASAPGDEVEHLVIELNRLCRTTAFELTLTIGEFVIRRLYGGDLTLWRQRGSKQTSFRRLSRHPNLSMSPSALYRSVAMYELSQRLGVTCWRHVSTSHLRLVLPLAPEDQARLLESTERHGWTVRHLDQEVAAIRARSPDVLKSRRGGRTRKSRLRSALCELKRCLASVSALLGATENLRDASPDSVRSIHDILDSMSRARGVLEQRLQTMAPPAPISSIAKGHEFDAHPRARSCEPSGSERAGDDRSISHLG